MRGEILGYVKCDISADLKRDNHSWWGLKRESQRASVLSELMWACHCLDYKRGELTAITEKDHFGLICSDNNKGSSNNLSSKAQSSSIRHRLGTQSGWIHFTCFFWVFFFFSFSAAVPDGEKLRETDSLNFYEARIPLRHHLRIEATARTQLRRCQRKLLIKQISFLLYTVRQERRKKKKKQALIKHTWRNVGNAGHHKVDLSDFVCASQQDYEFESMKKKTGETLRLVHSYSNRIF